MFWYFIPLKYKLIIISCPRQEVEVGEYLRHHRHNRLLYKFPRLQYFPAYRKTA